MVAPAARPSTPSTPASSSDNYIAQDDYVAANTEAVDIYTAEDGATDSTLGGGQGELDAVKKQQVPKQQQVPKNLQELKKEFFSLLENRKASKATKEIVKEMLQDLSVERREIEKNPSIKEAWNIERTIQERERYYEQNSMPLKDEKKLIEHIEKLKKRLRVVQKMNNSLTYSSTDRSSRQSEGPKAFPKQTTTQRAAGKRPVNVAAPTHAQKKGELDSSALQQKPKSYKQILEELDSLAKQFDSLKVATRNYETQMDNNKQMQKQLESDRKQTQAWHNRR